jgi:NAD(P)-dependent dehydrogenase (short-subunit alcohol dehydrogenase family)
MTSVLVTGANSGIGAAATSALLERGAHVIATVRTNAAAAKVRRAHPGADLTVALLDVTDAETAARIVERHHPDVVVNCAGDALLGAIMDIDDDAIRDEFDVMVIGPLRLARLACAGDNATGRVRIINISSSMAETTFPFTGWYGAAKAALDSASDALRIELAPRDIAVIRVECGAVRTEAWNEAGRAVDGVKDPSTRSGRRRWRHLMSLARPAFAEPDDVAAVIVAAALDPHPDPVYRVGFASRLGIVSALVPARVEDAVTSAVFGLRGARS